MNFLIEFPNSIELYKGVAYKDLDNKLAMPCWFALDINSARSYMSSFADIKKHGELYKFKLKRNLKLLNVLDLKFKLDFWDKCNKSYNIEDPIKLGALVAIGIVDLPTQELCVREVSKNCDRSTKIYANALAGHRCSSPENDRHLVSALIKIYGDKYDGYILPTNVPSCFHGMFHKEVCIFDCKDIFESIQFVEGVTGKHGGAPVDNYWYKRDQLTKEDWKEKPIKKKYDMFGNYNGTFIEQLQDTHKNNKKILKNCKLTTVR